MDEEMRGPALVVQVASEGEKLLDIPALGENRAGLRIDHVVEPQLQPLTFLKGAERLGFGPTRIEDRQDMSNPGLAMKPQFLDPAHRHPIRHDFLPEEHSRLRILALTPRYGTDVANLCTNSGGQGH